MQTVPFVIVLTIPLMLQAGCSHAQHDNGTRQELEVPPSWNHTLALGIEREPSYTGSDLYSTEPDFDIRSTYTSLSGNQYYLSLGEIGAKVGIGENVFLVSALEYEPGRDNDDDPVLALFPEQEDTVELQFTIAKSWENWTLAGVAQVDVLGRGKGVVYFLGLNYKLAISESVSINYSGDISFSDSEHAHTEIGISQETGNEIGIGSLHTILRIQVLINRHSVKFPN